MKTLKYWIYFFAIEPQRRILFGQQTIMRREGIKNRTTLNPILKTRFYKTIVNYKDSNPKMYFEELCNYYENN